MGSIFKHISDIQNSNEKWALCTVVGSKGSSPRKSGAKMMVRYDGYIKFTIGGGHLEQKVIENAIEVIKLGKPSLFEHKLIFDHGMCCGGTVEIFIEPIMNTKKLYIFGAGHTGDALAKISPDVDFEVVVIDERVEIVDDLSLNPEVIIVNKSHKQFLKTMSFDEHTYIVVLTHNHTYDKEIVEFCAQQKFAYLGMIGSQRKVEISKKGFVSSKSLTEEQMSKIDWPIGLDINAITPGEIAISILAKIINVKNTPMKYEQ